MATPRIGLPEILPNQAQKHITHNDALVILDALVQGSVISRTLTTPPGSPTAGDAYVVAAAATGAWAGKENDLAVYEAAAWSFYTPLTGYLMYCAADGEHITFDGSAWLSFTDALPFLASSGGTIDGDLIVQDASPSFQLDTTAVSSQQAFFRMRGARTSIAGTIAQIDFDNNGTGVEGTAAQWLITGEGDVNLSIGTLKVAGQEVFHTGNLATGSDSRRFGRVGIGGATPDATNPLAFYGENALFNSGGSINAKFNKNAPGNDASMTFQSAFSTKALMGLLGDDNFALKVGSGFHTAMVANESDGDVTFPNQRSVRQALPFGGRYYCYTDNRWTGPYPYKNAENLATSGGTGSTPTVDWDARGDHFFKSGSVLNSIKCSINKQSTEITEWYWKLYFQYPNVWDGTANTTGEFTRVEINGGTFNPSATGFEQIDFLASPFTCPADGHLLLVGKPGGALTANRYIYMTGYIDALLQL